MQALIKFIIVLFLSTSAFADSLTLKSTSVADGGLVSALYTCDKSNLTPEVHWSNAPANTKSFALVGISFDSPMGKIYGWTVYNIPPDVKGFPAGVKKLPPGAVVGLNSLGENYYRGPCPGDPKMHHYGLILYALDSEPSLESDLSPKDLMEAIKPHILQQAQIGFVYRH
jgi:Raf kinase inhibitor-like YbhB/YbcL family protein